MTDQLLPMATIVDDIDDVKMTLVYDVTERKLYALNDLGEELNALAEGSEFADQDEAVRYIHDSYARGWTLEWID